MHEPGRHEPISLRPTPHAADRAVAETRRLFQRVLSAWVCDLLELRQTGLDQPHWEPGAGERFYRDAA